MWAGRGVSHPCLRLWRIQLQWCFPTCTKDKTGCKEVAASKLPSFSPFLHKPQFNVQDPSLLSCFLVVDAVGILHTMSTKKKKKSVCSRTQICSWNLCVNCWKYCWVLSKSRACVMVDLIFICSFKPLISCWGWTAWNSFICFDIWGLIFPVTAPALPVLPNYEGNRRIKFLLLISVFACYTSGASLRRLRGA